VTIFIILAIVIAAVLLIIFYPRIKIYVTPATPAGYVEDCVNERLGTFIEDSAGKGGRANPENFIMYQGKEIGYLCYTNEYYKMCVMQTPFLKQSFETEIEKYLAPIAEKCVNEMASDFQEKGYQAIVNSKNVSVEILPKNVKIIVNAPITLTKESTQSFNKFIIAKNSKMYDLLMISQSILNYEARYGDSNPETFMLYYPDIRVEKLKQGDGSKIYIVSDRNTNEKFVFATRSLSWPAGYGLDEKYVRI